MAEYQNYREIPELEDIDQYEEDRLAVHEGRMTEKQFNTRYHIELNENPKPKADRTKLETDGMVDKWYEMDPELEQVLYDGTELQNGMIVLLEDANSRIDIREELSDDKLYLARRRNRWALVTRLEVRDSIVWFLAEYEDGTKAKVNYTVNAAWLSKFGKPVVGVAQVPVDDKVNAELERLRKEDFGG